MKFINICITALITFMLSSCYTDRIELDLNQGDNKRLVVEAWITDADEDQNIILSLTSDYFDSLQIEFVENALVELAYNGDIELFTYQGNGKYTSPGWRAETGITYTLNIEYNDNNYTSTSLMRAMPELFNVRSIVSEDYKEENDSIPFYDVFFDFQETPGEGDGYYAVDYKKEKRDSTILTDGEFTNDEFFDGLIFSDITVTEEDDFLLGDTIILETYSIGFDASDYLQDVSTEVFRGGLFDPPPVNPRSNISNNAVGYFITSGIQRETIVIE